MTEKRDDKTILIVEDDPELRLFISALLELEGYKVIFSGTGSKALNLLEKSRVDLVLLDLKLPDISGWSILERIRKEPKMAATPVIIFTASTGMSQHEHAAALGVAEYLTKPLSAAELKGAIARVFK
jgi:CheY-like chemotaxis protein